jgi:ElaB/YqjD/DUF883 family membrane-anchored ribosome-binding protein
VGETTDPLNSRGSAAVDRDDLIEDDDAAVVRTTTVTSTTTATPSSTADARPASDYPFVTAGDAAHGLLELHRRRDETPGAADAPASDEVAQARADIEQTRAQMTETIDAIKDRLSPANLVAEAKETVKETAKEQAHSVVEGAKDLAKGRGGDGSAAVSSAVDSVKSVVAPKAENAKQSLSGFKESATEKAHHLTDRVSTTAAGAGRSVKSAGGTAVDMIKANPLPAALAGFGPGWLLLSLRKQSGGGNGVAVRYDNDNARRYDIDNMDSGTGVGGGYYAGDRALSLSDGGEQRGLRDRVGETASNLKDRASDLKHRAEDVKDRVEDRLERVGDRIEDKAERFGDALKANPVPLALAGASLGWLLYSALRSSSSSSAPVRADYDRGLALNRGESYTDAGYRDAGLRVAGSEIREGMDEAGRGVREGLSHVGEGVSEAAGAVKDKAANAAVAVKDTAATAVGTVKDTAVNAAGAVKDTAASAAGAVKDTAVAAKDKAVDAAVTVKEKAGDALSSINVFIHEQPIAAAAIALGTGLLAGLLLPATYKEHELLGPTRDRLMDQAQDKAKELLNKAQNVATEAADTARQSARTHLGEAIVDSLTGASSAKDSIKDTAGKIKDEIKDAVRDAAQSQGLVSSP